MLPYGVLIFIYYMRWYSVLVTGCSNPYCKYYCTESVGRMRVELYSAWKKPGNTIGNTTRKKGKCGFYHFFVDQLKGLSTLNRSYIFCLVAGGCGFETECGVKITNPKLFLYLRILISMGTLLFRRKVSTVSSITKLCKSIRYRYLICNESAF